MFHFWLHSWKCEHDPLHHCKNTSQQNTQMITVLPNLKMSVDRHNYSLPLHTKSLHPAEYYHPRDLGNDRKGDPPTDWWYHCSTRLIPALAVVETMQTVDTGLHLLFHTDFLTMNKVAVQISSFMCDRLKGFFRSSYWVRALQRYLQMQWQHSAVTPMSLSK